MKRSVKAWLLVDGSMRPLGVAFGRAGLDHYQEMTGQKEVRCTVTYDDGKPARKKKP